MIPYSRQNIDEDDINAVVSVLRSDFITQGPKIQEFERMVADYCGVKYAVAVNSGTSALHLACLAAGISAGDEVITSPITFVASANCALFVGARPVFGDIRPDTYCIDPEQIKKKITARTKAIIPVDFAGHPCQMDEIIEMAHERELIVIEDAAHSLGAEYKGRRTGSLAAMTILSFHPVKHITTGEGGMVVTDNEEYYEKMVLLRAHGITRDSSHFNLQDTRLAGPWYYEMQELGFNYKITDFQCALGISQMKKLDAFIGRRREIARTYNKAFDGVDEIIRPVELPGCKSSYHLYPVRFRTTDRWSAFMKLRDKGLGVNVHYIPVHLQPYYRNKFNYKEDDYPVAENYYKGCVSLPIYPKMSDEEMEYVINTVTELAEKLGI